MYQPKKIHLDNNDAFNEITGIPPLIDTPVVAEPVSHFKEEIGSLFQTIQILLQNPTFSAFFNLPIVQKYLLPFSDFILKHPHPDMLLTSFQFLNSLHNIEHYPLKNILMHPAFQQVIQAISQRLEKERNNQNILKMSENFYQILSIHPNPLSYGRALDILELFPALHSQIPLLLEGFLKTDPTTHKLLYPTPHHEAYAYACLWPLGLHEKNDFEMMREIVILLESMSHLLPIKALYHPGVLPKVSKRFSSNNALDILLATVQLFHQHQAQIKLEDIHQLVDNISLKLQTRNIVAGEVVCFSATICASNNRKKIAKTVMKQHA